MKVYKITDIHGDERTMQATDMRALLTVYDCVYQNPEAVKVELVKK